MAAARWTDEKIKAKKLPAGKTEARLLVEPGLYLQLRARADGSTSKHWLFRAQVDGVRRLLTIGEYGADMGLAAASKKRLELQGQQDRAKKGEGDHPILAERFARRASKAAPTVAEAFDQWLADKRLGSPRKGGKPVRERTITILQQAFLADIQSRVGDAKIAQITPQAIQACIDAPRKRSAPGQAAQVYRTLRGLMTFATKRGFVTGADPMHGVENPKPYRPAPVIAANDVEITALLKAVNDSQLWEATKLAIEFQLLTGVRPGEVRLAVWSEFNPAKAAWTIPAERVKSGRDFQVHLSEQALAVLGRASRISGHGTYVFPGAKGGAMEKMAIARALSRIAARGESAKKLRPHDIRRTFRTLLSRIGVAPHIAELCMNHQETETMRRVYDGHDYFAEMADAWDKAGAHIAALGKGGAQVIQIKRRA
jgi:integrase